MLILVIICSGLAFGSRNYRRSLILLYAYSIWPLYLWEESRQFINHTCPPPGKMTTPVPCLRSLKCLLSFRFLPESDGDFFNGFSFGTPSTALLRDGSLVAAVLFRPDNHSGLEAPAFDPKAGFKLVVPTVRYCGRVLRNPLAIL